MTATLSAPLDSRPRWKRLRPPVLLAAGLLGASVLLHLRDPHHSGSWGFCPWLMLTGTYCPGCGGGRAVNDLTPGGRRAAPSSTVLFVGALPVLGFYYARGLLDRWNGVTRTVVGLRALLWSALFLAVAA